MFKEKLKFTKKIKDKNVNFELIDFSSEVPFSKITAVSVIAFNDKKEILCVSLEDRGLDIPGGHVESFDQNLRDTAVRETLEEAYVKITDVRPIALIRSDYYDDRVTYMAVSSAIVGEEKVFEFEYESDGRLYMNKDDFLRVYKNFDPSIMKILVDSAYDEQFPSRSG
tara:strand:+ start:44332 stop:44835 length:504 start_codon:yes stop_codon:yes gene_type:complete